MVNVQCKSFGNLYALSSYGVTVTLVELEDGLSWNGSGTELSS